MSRIPSRPPYEKPPRTERPSDYAYDKFRKQFLTDNPVCAACPEPSVRVHHICRGNNRGPTLTNGDFALAGCLEHGEAFDDLDIWPVARQLALKFATIMKAANRTRGRGPKAIDWADIFQYADVIET